MKLISRCLALSLLWLISACDSPDQKALKYIENGEALLRDNKPVKAKLEFQNALQIDRDLSSAWYGLAQIAKQNSDWANAYTLLERVIETDPNNLGAHVDKIKLLLGAWQLEEALEVSTASLQLAPDDARVLALRAAVIYKLEDREGAIDLAKRALTLDPANADAVVVLATAFLENGDIEQAQEYLDLGIRRDEKNVALQLIKVETLIRSNNYLAAENLLQHLIQLFPETDAFHYLLARFYLSRSREADAEKAYRALIESKPSDTRSKMELIRLLNSTRGTEVAIEELKELIKKNPESADLRFMLVQLYQTTGDGSGMIQTLQAIVNTETTADVRHRAQGLLAVYYMEAGDNEQAMVLINGILSEDPRHEQALLIKSSQLVDRQKFEEAISGLRSILKDNPESAPALLLLGRAHELNGMRDLAEDRYLRAHQVSGQDPQFSLPFAHYLIRLHRPHRAEQVLEEVLLAHPNHIDSLALLAKIRTSTGDWAGAQKIADQIERLGDGGVSSEIQGTLYAAQKDYEQSIGAFRQAYQALGSDERPLFSLVHTYLKAGKPDEAHEFLDSVLVAGKSNASAWLLKGQVHFSQGEDQQAVISFNKVLEQEPSNLTAYQYLSRAQYRMGEPEGALSILEHGLTIAPDDFSLNFTKANLLERERAYDEAIAVYERLFQARPNADIVANNLASLLSEHRNDIESLHRAHELANRFHDSNVPHFKDTLGWIYYRLGKTEDARSLIEDAIRETPTIPVFHYHLGMTYKALQEDDSAHRQFQKALELAGESSVIFRDKVKAEMKPL